MLAPAQTPAPACTSRRTRPTLDANLPPPTKRDDEGNDKPYQRIPIGPPRPLFQAAPNRASPRLIPAPGWFWISTSPLSFRHLTRYLRTPTHPGVRVTAGDSCRGTMCVLLVTRLGCAMTRLRFWRGAGWLHEVSCRQMQIQIHYSSDSPPLYTFPRPTPVQGALSRVVRSLPWRPLSRPLSHPPSLVS